MWEALREATDEEMERDPTVCVMGAFLSGWRGGAVVPPNAESTDLAAGAFDLAHPTRMWEAAVFKL